MSRFFQGGLSDSDFSSSEEELLSSSEEEELSSSDEEAQNDSTDSEFANDSDDDSDSDDERDEKISGPAYFLKKSHIGAKDSDESSDDDEDKIVVKSAKEKLIEEFQDSISVLDNSRVLGDWPAVLAEFDKLSKLLVKATQQNFTTPLIYIKSLSELDEAVHTFSSEDINTLKKTNAASSQALRTIKQKVKKAVRENASSIEAHRANPEGKPPASATESTTTATSSSTTKSSNSVEIFKNLKSVAESRGKKNVDIHEQIKLLEEMAELASSVYERISLFLMLIPLRFDTASNSSLWSTENWKATAADVNSLFTVLEDNFATYRVLETAEPLDDIEQEPEPNADGVREILGSVLSYVERLDDEFIRSLQVIDPFTTEYIERLRDEQEVYSTIIRAQLYYERILPKESLTKAVGDTYDDASASASAISSGREQIARIASKRLDHLYFKSSKIISTIEVKTWKDARISKQTSRIISHTESSQNPDKLMDALASILYQQSNIIFRKRAMLSHIYYYALNNQYQKARNMLLVSHLQSNIHTSDPGLQVLFNRALVQLGLCAFRNGLVQDAQQVLQEIATSPRYRELLGQTTQRSNVPGQRYTPSTNIDKQRVLPFHMHINMELLDSVFLTSSLLIEIPQYAQLGSSLDAKKRLQTKSFRRILEFHEKQIFQGPPENTRDHIMHAAKALQAGNWKKSAELLTAIKSWDLLPDSDKIRDFIRERVQVEGLRTYLFQFKSFYSKLSISKLATIFELPESKVSAIVTKMIFHEEIAAGLDQISNSIIFNKSVEMTRLQEFALTLADRAATLSERNERLAGLQQSQGNERHSYNSGNNNQHHHHNHRQHNRTNVKFAPVTGALSSAPGTISGALNGMQKRKSRTSRA